MSFDGKHLLKNTDVFIGSGGTMTAEAAFNQEFQPISYNAIPNIIEDFLVKKTSSRKGNRIPIKISRCYYKIFSIN